MAQIDAGTAGLVAGFAALVGGAGWSRVRLDREVETLGPETLTSLGWRRPSGAFALTHSRRVADRLILRGLPTDLPLSAAGWRHLRRLRIFALCACFYLAVVPAALYGVWILTLLLGVPVAAILLARAWMVGPWGP